MTQNMFNTLCVKHCAQSIINDDNLDQLLVLLHLAVHPTATITPTQVMVYHWWIPCETLVHTGSR